MPSTTGVDVCVNLSEVQLSLLNLKKAVMFVHKHYNPYIINRLMFINRDVPQGTVLALTLII